MVVDITAVAVAVVPGVVVAARLDAEADSSKSRTNPRKSLSPPISGCRDSTSFCKADICAFVWAICDVT